MRSSLNSFIFIVVFILTLSAAARAEIFTAYLSGAQENPAVATTATGYARIVVNESTGSLTFTVVFNNLSSNQTLSHIHAPAPLGTNVGVAINFGTVGGTSGTISGVTTITPTQLSQLRQHLGYVNVHSSNFPAGEIRGQLGVQRPVDDDGDGRTDFSLWRFPDVNPPEIAQITYWNLNSTGGLQTAVLGDANFDVPVPGDYDGDAKIDIAVYREGVNTGDQSVFYIIRSTDNTIFIRSYGLSGDQAICRDYDGDGITDLAIFRRGTAVGAQAYWWIIRSTVPTNDLVTPFGTTGSSVAGTGDEPVPGDYDGDGKFDLAVYRHGISPSNNFIVFRSSDSAVTFQQFGNFTSDYVLPGDYDGDGKTDYAVARTGSTATSPLVWWIMQSSNGQVRVQTFGRSNDLPAQGDYDGDARTDLAIYRTAATGSPTAFWVQRSFDNLTQVTNWGVGGDFPVNFFDAR